jgi:ABC-type uncharacterized transport system permease subunit
MNDGLFAAIPLLLPALRQTTPLVLAGMGGIMSERAGVINIALEGMMAVGAFVGVWIGQKVGAGVGLLAALASGGLLGLLHVFLTQKLRMNHVISGVAINIITLPATTFLLRRLWDASDPKRAVLDPPVRMDGFILAAVILPFAVHFLLYRTAFGLRLRAVGESAESARMAGIHPLRLRVVGVTLSGVFAGLAGAYLSMAQAGRFSDGMVQGRGFIALAAVICGRWTPLGAALAALVFGFFDVLQMNLQGRVPLPGEFLLSLPYLFTILAAMLLRPIPPAALGREDEE